MIVYRIETRDGAGPYASPIVKSCLLRLNIFDTPAPKHDGILTNVMGWKFGFSNFEHLMNWFGPVLKILAENDYVVSVYEISAEDVVVGGRQIAFRRTNNPVSQYEIGKLIPA